MGVGGPLNNVFTRKEETHQGEGRVLTRGRDWSDVAESQGTSSLASHPQKLEEPRTDSPLETSEGGWPCQYLSLETVSVF